MTAIVQRKKQSKIIILNLDKRGSKKILVLLKYLNHETVKSTCCGARDSTESRFNLEDIKITDNCCPFCISSSCDRCHSCTDKLPSLSLPSFPAKSPSLARVTDGACTESRTTPFSTVVLNTPLASPIPNFGTNVSVWH